MTPEQMQDKLKKTFNSAEESTAGLTPEQCKQKIQDLAFVVEYLRGRIDRIVHDHMPEFHFIDHQVILGSSWIWSCAKSPAGVCVFKKDQWGRPQNCIYCHGPTERK